MNIRCIKNQSNEFISIYFEEHGGKVMAKDKDASKKKKVSSKALKAKWKNKLAYERRTFKYTVIVVATVIFFMVFFWVLDVGIGNLIELFR